MLPSYKSPVGETGNGYAPAGLSLFFIDLIGKIVLYAIVSIDKNF